MIQEQGRMPIAQRSSQLVQKSASPSAKQGVKMPAQQQQGQSTATPQQSAGAPTSKPQIRDWASI
jgi:hypothetical protein